MPKIIKDTNVTALTPSTKTVCHCKRSGCIKNYCQCYDRKIACGMFCKCLNCQNRASSANLSGDDQLSQSQGPSSNRNKSQTSSYTSLHHHHQPGTASSEKSIQSDSVNKRLLETDAFDTIAQSIFSTAKQCHQMQCDAGTTERRILETFHEQFTRISKSIDAKMAKE